MGFTKTSEGRVFFKNADNDDAPRSSTSAPTPDPVMPSDSTQMQTLLLLKSLNAKLKNSKEDSRGFKKQLIQYKSTINGLEEKTSAQETNYIDLEQKFASKQNEANKKSTRVENSVKNTIKQLEEARALVKELEGKVNSRDESLDNLKITLNEQKKKDDDLAKKQQILEEKQKEQNAKIITRQKSLENQRGEQNDKISKRQKTLETQQKAQGEKMVDSVAAYVALTKRVSETETRSENLDNKIEDTASEYLKLDRKIDKAIEDRNRILRKVDRIEQAVLETRDALNAKAMVLLTDQGAVASANMGQVDDTSLKTDPMALNHRLQEETLMPWWRRPLRIQGTSLALMMVVILLLGWIMSEARHPAQPNALPTTKIAPPPPTIALHQDVSDSYENYQQYEGQSPEEKTVNLTPYQSSYETPSTALAVSDQGNKGYYEYIDEEKPYNKQLTQDDDQTEDMAQTDSNYGITIHKGYNDPTTIINNEQADINDINTLDINNEKEMLAAMANDPDKVASRLNQIEPASLMAHDKAEPAIYNRDNTKVKRQEEKQSHTKTYNNNTDIIALRKRIKPDPSLTEIAKKIETQAFEGVPEAQHDMGAIYVAGHGQIKKDLKRAVLWFKEAAKNNISNAKYNLGVLYHQGLGIEQSVTKAMALYNDAAMQGHPEAQYNLGIANIEGIGVPYNPVKAAEFFEMAANKDVTEAAYNLGLIYENGLLGDTQPEQALTWYKQAADQGSPEAKSALAQLASSLGIGINDVNSIVERLQKTHKINLNGGSASSSAQSYMTSQIQKELMRRGLYPGPVDGMSGPMTQNAIKSFQRAANLEVNGQASQPLLSYLKASSNPPNHL